MTGAVFLQKLKLRGIIERKKDAEEYIKTHPKEEYDEADFEDAYHWNEGQRYGRHPEKHREKKLLTTNGSNMVDPQYQNTYYANNHNNRSDRWR